MPGVKINLKIVFILFIFLSLFIFTFSVTKFSLASPQCTWVPGVPKLCGSDSGGCFGKPFIPTGSCHFESASGMLLVGCEYCTYCYKQDSEYEYCDNDGDGSYESSTGNSRPAPGSSCQQVTDQCKIEYGGTCVSDSDCFLGTASPPCNTCRLYDANGNGIIDFGEGNACQPTGFCTGGGGSCNNNSVCESGAGEDPISCPGDCTATPTPSTPPNTSAIDVEAVPPNPVVIQGSSATYSVAVTPSGSLIYGSTTVVGTCPTGSTCYFATTGTQTATVNLVGTDAFTDQDIHEPAYLTYIITTTTTTTPLTYLVTFSANNVTGSGCASGCFDSDTVNLTVNQAPSGLSGVIYNDTNNNSLIDSGTGGDRGILDSTGSTANCTRQTVAGGFVVSYSNIASSSINGTIKALVCSPATGLPYYRVTNIPSGSYNVSLTIPSGWVAVGGTSFVVSAPPGGEGAQGFLVKVAPPNNPPVPTNVTVRQPDYCASGPAATVFWNYTDPNGHPQSAYQVQIDNQSSFASPEVDSGKILSSSNSFFGGSGVLQFNTNYRARVKVWDSLDLASNWVTATICIGPVGSCQSGGVWKTPKHAYPSVNFNWTPANPGTSQPVQFTDQTVYYDSTGTGQRAWIWLFGDLSTSTIQNPTHSYLAPGTYNVSETVFDRDAYFCLVTKPLTIQNASNPIIWKEVNPR